MSFRSGDMGNTQGRVHRIINSRSSEPVPHQCHHDQIISVLRKGFVIHPTPDPQIRNKQTRILTRRCDDPCDQFLAFRAAHIYCYRSFSLVHSSPEMALSALCYGPTLCVQSTFNTVKADHICPHLCQCHSRQWDGNKC